MTFRELTLSLMRSIKHHGLSHVLTVTVLSGTFTLVALTLLVSLNLKNVLVTWGDEIQMTAFVAEGISETDLERTKARIAELSSFKSVAFISKSQAKDEFSARVSSYAPDLVADPDFQSAFPASFQLKLKSQDLISQMSEIAKKVGIVPGITEVSYGQGWVQNYARFASALNKFGLAISFVLMCGSIFIIGNALRMSISQRTEEIEILELIGATPGRIRTPFIFEGIVLGGIAGIIACTAAYGLYLIQVKLLLSELPVLDIASKYKFFSALNILSIVAAGSLVGYLGSLICLRPLTDGWYASRRKNRFAQES